MSDTRQPPEQLWKYRDWSDKAKRMITTGEVHYTPLQNLNDPFEAHWCERLPTDPEELDQFARELCAVTFPFDSQLQRHEHFSEMIRSIRELTADSRDAVMRSAAKFRHGLLCLSEINDDILMWSYYADCHKGVCISLRTALFPHRRIYPARYTDNAPVVNAWAYVKNDRNVFMEASCSKAFHWQYECEWRAIDIPGPKVYPGCVDRVVIGAAATPETREQVFEAVAAAGHPIEIFEAQLHRTKYKLRIVPAD